MTTKSKISEASFGIETSNEQAQVRRRLVSAKKTNSQPLMEDSHAFLEKTLIDLFTGSLSLPLTIGLDLRT